VAITGVVRTSEPAAAGLVVFDLDGTLIRGRSVCELLAARLGREERMKEIETLTTETALTQARSEMASWYREASEQQLVSFLEPAELAPGAVEALALLRRHGFVCAISSITWLFAVEWFAERLNIDHCQGTCLSAGGSIEHVCPRDKGKWVRELARALGVPAERVATVGDSWRDLEMFRAGAKAFWVGGNVHNMPECVTRVDDGDLFTVAQAIVDDWGV
jgi:HAD superfamily phosphoserine phosphatase-like hydrolase